LGDNILAHGIERYVKRFVEREAELFILLYRVKDPFRFDVAVIGMERWLSLLRSPGSLSLISL